MYEFCEYAVNCYSVQITDPILFGNLTGIRIDTRLLYKVEFKYLKQSFMQKYCCRIL